VKGRALRSWRTPELALEPIQGPAPNRARGQGLHVLLAAAVDLLLQVDELAALGVKAGVTRARAAHARYGIAVAARAGGASGTVYLVPQRPALLDP
jgi:hypothetical protein